MATTDAKAGFRLPWSSDRQSSDSAEAERETVQPALEATAWPTEDQAAPATALETAPQPDAPAAPVESAPTEAAPVEAAPGPTPAPAPLAPPPGRKPSRFMADLTKAMQAAAEEARGRALAQLQADAKSHVETIHGRASTESANLRRRADDDVAAVREWSKAEIARIREETETKITERKARLESEIEQHAGVIEREIDAVQRTVATFEAEMASFFERLLGEDDPSRFATMAENLPEPPVFEAIVPTPLEEMAAAKASVETVAEPMTPELEPQPVGEIADDPATATTETDADDRADGFADGAPVEAAAAEVPGETAAEAFDREAAFAAIQAAAEAAKVVEGAAPPEPTADPRLAALGMTADFDAAEAEALAAADASDEEIPEIADEAVASRIAGLVPSSDSAATDESPSTQVVVVGLVSVASIASFKRHLGRLPGVQSVGVSSGPEGEFIFAVKHGAEVVLRELVPSLPAFQARVTGSTDGVVQVTAHDPESDA